MLTFLYLLSGVVVIVLAGIVLVNDPKARLNQLFALFVGSSVLWLAGNHIANVGDTAEVALLATRWSAIAAVGLGYTLALFAAEYTQKKISIWIKVAYPVVAGLMTIAGYSSLVIESAEPGALVIGFGPLYYPFMAGLAVLFMYPVTLIFIDYKSRTGARSIQSAYILTAIALTFLIAFMTNVVLPSLGIVEPAIYGALGVVIFSVITGISIVKHSLFDIRLVVARSIAYLLVFSSFIGAYLIILFVVSALVSSDGLTLSQQVYYAFIGVLIAAAIQPLKKIFDKFTDKVFYRDAYDSQEILNQFSDFLVAEIEIRRVINYVKDTLERSVKPDKITMLLYDEGTMDNWHDIEGSFELAVKRKLSNALEYQTSPVLASYEDMTSVEPFTMNIMNNLKDQKIHISIRLATQDQLVGFLLLGEKKSGGQYNNEDVKFLTIMANELSVAMQNAQRFAKIQSFNITLKHEIDEATRQLRESNKKLRDLDDAKDDFISMASHQLRTPLTSVKGYISMVMEGDVGNVSDKQKEMLSAAYSSSQRMVYLISDLLNVSRLKTGKFIIDPTEVDMPAMIEDEIKQLVASAASRRVKLHFVKPKKFPKVMLDETKTRQVVMNFVDNAIYYSKGGNKIEIKLTANDKKIEFTVKDQGIGVPKTEQSKLFTKFYRANNAKKARPDGTGLGLFMAKKVIVAQGGAVIFKSNKNKGSTFGFTIPLSRVSPEKFGADKKRTISDTSD